MVITTERFVLVTLPESGLVVLQSISTKKCVMLRGDDAGHFNNAQQTIQDLYPAMAQDDVLQSLWAVWGYGS